MDELGNGAAYLASLKPSLPFREAEAGVFPSRVRNKFGSEKRKTQRYRCQGSAHLRDIGGAAATWATVTDISMNGCYVEVAACFRVGAKVSLTIEVMGVRIALMGKVRTAYPGLGMGISFDQISAADGKANREDLLALVRSLAGSSPILEPRVVPMAKLKTVKTADDIPNPSAALQALIDFFEHHPVMGQHEFFDFLRKRG